MRTPITNIWIRNWSCESICRFLHRQNKKNIREDITEKLKTCSNDKRRTSGNINPSEFLSTFTHAKKNEISKFIKRPTTKSCDLGRIPTWVLQLCLSEVLPVITHIVNASFSSSEVTRQLKLALVIPLLKKGSNRSRDSKTIRPVSNLTYISKLIERVVADRLNVFYHKEISMKCSEVPTNSMETALLRVQNDLLDRKYKDYVYGRC